jgi:hypothetical protein
MIVAMAIACFLPFTGAPNAAAGEAADAVAISSRVSADYIRTRLPNGSIEQETIAFAKGGLLKGTEAATVDMLNFVDVAETIARPLAVQGYVPSRDPVTTRLLIVVYWGTTRTPEHSTDSVSGQNLARASAAALAANHPQAAHFNPIDSMAPSQMAQASTTGYAIRSPDQIDTDNAMSGALAASAAEDAQRNTLDAQNARMLGYDSLWDATAQSRGTALEYRRKDLVDELEGHRYFVVLMAYDYQMLRKKRKAQLLWETRFSVREHGPDFSKQLAAMAEGASRYFGKGSGGLIRGPLPEGHVKVGEIKDVGSGATR